VGASSPAASVVVLDAAPGDQQEAHTHPVEEVVVVQQGAATFFLGAQQARIVRAGEVVRIPAHIPHRWVVAGDSRLLAVAVHGAADIVTSPV
jgi:quercetin dioxygenase-like cupin family protein